MNAKLIEAYEAVIISQIENALEAIDIYDISRFRDFKVLDDGILLNSKSALTGFSFIADYDNGKTFNGAALFKENGEVKIYGAVGAEPNDR